MSRFNRWITGRATGVVFTGGGARVATQIGVLKRFIAEGVAVDMVGGVGTGLVIACLFAMYQDIEAVESAARDIFKVCPCNLLFLLYSLLLLVVIVYSCTVSDST